MGVKIYISGISGNKEVKKRQQRVLMILDSRNIGYSVVDITEPGREADKDFMQNKATAFGITNSDLSPRHPLPPQLFNDEEYCGDYDQFDLANEIDELDIFLKLSDKKENADVTNGNETNVTPAPLGNGTIEDDTNKHETEAETVEDVVETIEDAAESIEDDAETTEDVAETIEDVAGTTDNGTIESVEQAADVAA